MLARDIHHIIYGHNYYSFFLGINKLRQNQSTLLLADQRTNYGQHFLNYCSEMDRLLFLYLGKKFSVSAFEGVEQFLTAAPVQYILGQSAIRLGDSPSRNFSELCRRFQFAFCPKSNLREWLAEHSLDTNSFDQQFTDYLQQIISQVVGLKKTNTLDFSFFYYLAPNFIKEIYNVLSAFYYESKDTSAESWNLRCLLSSTRAFAQEKISLQMGKIELFHLLLLLLCPHYRVNLSTFLERMEEQFHELGGEVRRVDLEEWLFDKGRPWAINLSSFEGLVMPKEQSIVGNIRSNFPIHIDSHGAYHTSMVFEWKIRRSKRDILPLERSVFCHSDFLGTDRPLFVYSREEDKITIQVFFLYVPAGKLEFVVNEIRQSLISQLSRNFVFSEDWILEEKFYEGDDLLLDVDYEHGKFSQSQTQNPCLLDQSIITEREIVKDVSYYGAFRQFPLGKLSLVLELCPLD